MKREEVRQIYLPDLFLGWKLEVWNNTLCRHKGEKTLPATNDTVGQVSNTMTLDSLLLNLNDTSWDECVTLDNIATDEDAKKLQAEGYPFVISQEKFSALLPEIRPEMVYLSKSFSVSSFYFNPETLAACILHIAFFSLDDGATYVEQAKRAIKIREAEVAAGDYKGSVLSLSDGLRMGYFQRLIEKVGSLDGKLYSMFFDIYVTSDYGFRAIPTEMLETIIASKPESAKEETRKQVDALPDLVTVYRGGNTSSTPYTQAWSWSPNINTAHFFAARRGDGPGYVAKGTVHKEDILEAFLDSTSEPELIIRPGDVKIQEVTTLRGLDEVVDLIKVICVDFQKYSAELDKVTFQTASNIHDKLHSKRVLIFCLMMAELLQLPSEDVETLAWAAVYHDTRRINDDAEPGHGKRAALYYRNHCPGSYDKVTNIIIHYHSLGDQKGYEAIAREIQGQEARERATKLYNIFKDADALDRQRLGGLRAIDVRMLRNPVAQELTLASRLIYEQMKD